MTRIEMLRCIYVLVCLMPVVLASGLVIEDDNCGGNITDNKGNYTLPSANQTCVWRFSSNKTRRFFAFTSLDLTLGDRILVYDNDHQDKRSNGSDKLVGNFTGKLDPFIVVTFANVSTIVYQRAANQSKTSSFVIMFNTNKCEISVQKTGSIVKSPIYYPTPLATLTCFYHVKAVIDLAKPALTFSSVNVTKGDLTVWSGNSPKGIPLMNATGPLTSLGDVLSGNKEMLLKTVFPTSRVDKFSATIFTTEQACKGAGMMTLEKATNVTSPNYPSNYDNNLDCRYVITAPPGHTIDVSVIDVNLPDNVDAVTLTDGDSKSSPVLASLTAGFKQNGLLLTSGNKLWVRMRTDETRSGRGFRMLLTPRAWGGAGRDQGRISTPTVMPEANDNKTDIFFVLYAKDGMQVRLSVNDSKLSPTSSVEFRDGPSVNDSLIGYFSSQDPSYTVVSSGGVMLVRARGFFEKSTLSQHHLVADFTSVPPGSQWSFSGETGGAALKESDLNGSATYIVVNPNPKGQVALTIDDLYVPENATVTVYRGPSDQSAHFIRYTTPAGENPVKVVPVIYTNQTRIEYQIASKPAVVPDKILLRFSYRIIQGCDGPELSTPSGDSVTSPLYPNLYPFNAKCRWSFTPVHNKSLRLSFSDISLAGTDSLSIEADDYSVHKAGNQTVVNMTSRVLDVLTGDLTGLSDLIIPMHQAGLNTTKVKVTFNSVFQGSEKDLKVSTGFKVNYEHLDCGGNITDKSQAMTTPGFPKAVSAAQVKCLWVINLPARPASSNTSVNIIKFKLGIKNYHPDTNTSQSSLVVRDGGSQNAPDIPVKMADGDTKEMLSRTNQLWILYTFSRKDFKSQGFSMSINFDPHVCAKKDQCANGVCLHSEWRCNGRDECGDGSDELDCLHATNAVSRLVLGMSILVTFILATLLACLVPVLYKRFKYPHYSELRDLMTPVPT